jgi:hypothetical protein
MKLKKLQCFEKINKNIINFDMALSEIISLFKNYNFDTISEKLKMFKIYKFEFFDDEVNNEVKKIDCTTIFENFDTLMAMQKNLKNKMESFLTLKDDFEMMQNALKLYRKHGSTYTEQEILNHFEEPINKKLVKFQEYVNDIKEKFLKFLIDEEILISEKKSENNENNNIKTPFYKRIFFKKNFKDLFSNINLPSFLTRRKGGRRNKRKRKTNKNKSHKKRNKKNTRKK